LEKKKGLTVDIAGLTMPAKAELKPRRRRKESSSGAPVARFEAWVGAQIAYVVTSADQGLLLGL